IGSDHLRVGLLDRGRDHHHRGVAQIVRVVADCDRYTLLAQALDDVALGDIGALHGIAEDAHHLGDAGHADAADTDEMDRADIDAGPSHAGTAPATAPARSTFCRTKLGSAPGSRPVRSTRSARSFAAA